MGTLRRCACFVIKQFNIITHVLFLYIRFFLLLLFPSPGILCVEDHIRQFILANSSLFITNCYRALSLLFSLPMKTDSYCQTLRGKIYCKVDFFLLPNAAKLLSSAKPTPKNSLKFSYRKFSSNAGSVVYLLLAQREPMGSAVAHIETERKYTEEKELGLLLYSLILFVTNL